jgi:hypothetical protein
MDATLAAPADPESPAEPRASRAMLAVLGGMAALHALLPAGVAWILHHGGLAPLGMQNIHEQAEWEAPFLAAGFKKMTRGDEVPDPPDKGAFFCHARG